MPCTTHSAIRMAVRSSRISIKGEGRTEVVPTRATQPGYALVVMPCLTALSTGAHGSAAISGSAFDVIASKVIESTSKRSPRARLGLDGRAAIVISDTRTMSSYRDEVSEREATTTRGRGGSRGSLCFSLLVPSSSLLLLSCLSPSACLPGSWSCLLATPSISVHHHHHLVF